MATLKSLFIASAFTACTVAGMAAEAKIASRHDIDSAQALVDTFNSIYPEVQVWLPQPAAHHVIFKELEALEAQIQGANQFDAGALIHLACKNPACGGTSGGKN